MSNIALVSPATGTATFSITTPSGTSTDRTLTLPDNSGTVLTSATTTGFPAGSVLQVVQGSTTTRVQISTSTYTDSNLTASITPTSSSSKILVLISQNIGSFCSNNSGNSGALRIVRDSTTVFTSENVINIVAGLGVSGELRVAGQYSFVYLDSPSTTSSVTYKTQIARLTGIDRIEPQSNNGTSNSTITLMEIAA
jgi:hypothetical protein